jgi:TM2 domain-containing membrane protein YozV
MQRINSWIALIFCSHAVGAQINGKFIEHLTSYSLQTEHRTYLTSIKNDSDSLHYFEANYYLSYFNDSLFLQHYFKSKTLCQNDTNLLKRAGLLMLNEAGNKIRAVWFESLPPNSATATLQRLTTIYLAANYPNHLSDDGIFSEGLRKTFRSYKKAVNKKPVLAASMSALLPGLGKIYAGKTISGLSALLINSAYALQGWESYNKLGIRHPLTIFNAAAFTIFYFSNIYGGYKCIIDLRRERKKQFIKDATFLYY